jgi:L-seryl-tRNA(Ser) seleniumtransferase
MTELESKYGVKRILNAMGMSTMVGANVVPPQVQKITAEAMSMSFDIDELQAAANKVIAKWTGAEAGCVTACSASGIAETVAAAMTGSDLGRIVQLPDTTGMKNEVVMQLGHNLNFGGEVWQMIRLAGAELKLIGTANHGDAFHLRNAIGPNTAAVVFVENGAVHPEGHFIPLEVCVEIAASHGLPVIVDAAGEPDVRPFVQAGAAAVITSAHKMMGAPTSGLVCGKKEFMHATYLQNWGIGRAMKIGKEGIAGCMAAVEHWYSRDLEAEQRRFDAVAEALGKHAAVHHPAGSPFAQVELPQSAGLTARQFANSLREGEPSVWVRSADDKDGSRMIALNLRVMDESDADLIGKTIKHLIENPKAPDDNVPFHDLYWSEKRLMKWGQ